jgi:uncharacterized BrkB/YihY/UPF0761 family membrane protein
MILIPFIAAASAGRAYVVLPGILAGIFLLVLVVYIWRCWKRGAVKIYGRTGTQQFSRKWQPSKYWMVLAFYALLAAGIVLMLIIMLAGKPA